jgi:hypothetical protein
MGGMRMRVAPPGVPRKGFAPGFECKIDHELQIAEIEETAPRKRQNIPIEISCLLQSSRLKSLPGLLPACPAEPARR